MENGPDLSNTGAGMETQADITGRREIIEHALNNFASYLETADYASVLDFMGIGKLQFLARKQMVSELQGLYTALWRLALARSFPENAEAMFREFLAKYPSEHPDKNSSKAMERAAQYWGMLEPGGDADFNEAARHLISFLVKYRENPRSLTLKIALHLRKTYCTIFDHLI